jgi:hypothetical protein
MSFVKDDDALFAQLGRDVLGDFRIKQVVEGEDDHVEVRQLRLGQQLRRKKWLALTILLTVK